jgi:hypothetical protein
VYVKFTARYAFLELPPSGTLKIERLESQIIKVLGAKKPKGLYGIAKHWLRSPMAEAGEPLFS